MKNITLNGTEISLPTEIPYSSLIAKGMKAVAWQQAAVETLLLFENTDVTPYQIEEMKATIANLQERVKKMENC